MKTMTCTDLGGTCDVKMMADSPEEMMTQGWQHVEAAHPDLAVTINAMPQEEKDKWQTDFKAKWDATPEEEAAEVVEETPAAEETPAI